MTSRDDRIQEIVHRLGRRQSTATVLLNHAVAERLGLGPSDHKCLDLLTEFGPMTGSRLAAITGLTTGAVTGIVARLTSAGFVQRRPDPTDGRKQILAADPGREAEVAAVFRAFHAELTAMLEDFDGPQLETVVAFLERTADIAHRHTAALRAEMGTPTAAGVGS